MSATNHSLLEEIQKAEAALAECNAVGDLAGVHKLNELLTGLRQRFFAQSQALNEAKSLLKG